VNSLISTLVALAPNVSRILFALTTVYSPFSYPVITQYVLGAGVSMAVHHPKHWCKTCAVGVLSPDTITLYNNNYLSIWVWS